METEQVVKRLHEGMEVHATDGTKLGKITQILYSADTSGRLAASEEETCMEVHHGFFRRERLYLPCRLVARRHGQHGDAQHRCPHGAGNADVAPQADLGSVKRSG
jgi:hypothetical protein